MIRWSNLHFLRRLRVALPFALLAIATSAFAQIAPISEPNVKDLFPSAGGRPEFLTVFDMRKDTDAADRILAKSVQGLYNTGATAHDKIYLILNDDDANLLDWLVKQQFVLSAGYLKTMNELMLRWPSRDAVTADATSINAAVGVAGCERWLIATDANVIEKYHLNIRKSLSGKWTSEVDADRWLLDNYGDQLNKRIVSMPASAADLSLLDYGIANKVFNFRLGDDTDQVADKLHSDFDSNIPCLSSASESVVSQDPALKQLSENAEYVLPLNGLSNLSVWTTFKAFDPQYADIYWHTTRDARRYATNDLGEQHFNIESFAQKEFTASDLAWLYELAPPLFESAANTTKIKPDDRDAFHIGVIDQAAYGSAFGADRDRIWTSYTSLSRGIFDLTQSVASGY